MVDIEGLEKEQLRLAKLVKREDDLPSEAIVTGIDVSYSGNKAIGCAVISNYQTRINLGIITHETTPETRYIPGLFQLREGPIILELLKRIDHPGIVLIDGNGILHPRRFGLASYIGLKKDIPTIGIAKRLMIGEIAQRSKDSADIIHNNEVVGRAVWLGKRKPVYVSIGHRISLDSAVKIVHETCVDGYPEVLRKAHTISNSELKKLNL